MLGRRPLCMALQIEGALGEEQMLRRSHALSGSVGTHTSLHCTLTRVRDSPTRRFSDLNLQAAPQAGLQNIC